MSKPDLHDVGHGWFTDDKEAPRFLHVVEVDGIEFIFWNLDQALDKLDAEPEATFERIMVH
ncbi:MAG: hypothetical protein KDG89_11770 [Geminicoccaceae bacterium]|nr:hypothetical protein [Geminicoccaceae bacterium]